MVAAGPDSLVVASTETVRKAIAAPAGEGSGKTRPFEPQATIPLPARPTHIAFTANDDALLLATENGSQISVFETSSLTQGNAQPALSVSTNGVTLRALVPNPDPTSTLAAMVTANGELFVADLKSGNLVSGSNGPVLRNGVSSVAWSNKGKQLVAGMADGTADQMTPDGTRKDQIPRPSDLEGECHSELSNRCPLIEFFLLNTVQSHLSRGLRTIYSSWCTPPTSFKMTWETRRPFIISSRGANNSRSSSRSYLR